MTNRNILLLINNTYFLLVVLFSGYANSFIRSEIGVIVFFTVSLLVLLLNKLILRKEFITLVTIWTVYCLITMILYNEIFLGFYVRHLGYFTSGYILYKVYREYFFYKYENTVYYLAIISLFFFSWQLVHISSLRTLINIFDVANFGPNEEGGSTKNMLLYTMHHSAIYRNAGFAWEPGPYSIFLSFALYLNILRNNFRIKTNLRFYIFIISIISTTSTTGYIITLVILGYTYIKDKEINFSRVLVILFAIVCIIPVITNVDFILPKIISLYSSGDANEIISQARNSASGTNFSFGRFAALEIGLQDFKNNLWLGYAGASKLTYIDSLDLRINMVSGFATIPGMYGIFWTIILLMVIKKASKNIAVINESKSYLGFFIIFFLSLFSFHSQTFFILYAPLFFFMVSSKSLGNKKFNY